MFAGHYAVAFGAKALAPTVPLGALFVVAQASDIVSSVLLLFGVEQVRIDPNAHGQQAVAVEHTPYSHGLVGSVVLALVVVLVTRRWWRPAGRTAAVVIGLVVLTHPILDLVPLEPRLLLMVEAGLYVAGCALYLRATPKAPIATRIAMGAFMLALLSFSVVVATSSPPSSAIALALANLAAYGVLAAGAGWLDRAGSARRLPAAGSARR